MLEILFLTDEDVVLAGVRILDHLRGAVDGVPVLIHNFCRAILACIHFQTLGGGLIGGDFVLGKLLGIGYSAILFDRQVITRVDCVVLSFEMYNDRRAVDRITVLVNDFDVTLTVFVKVPVLWFAGFIGFTGGSFPGILGILFQ